MLQNLTLIWSLNKLVGFIVTGPRYFPAPLVLIQSSGIYILAQNDKGASLGLAFGLTQRNMPLTQ